MRFHANKFHSKSELVGRVVSPLSSSIEMSHGVGNFYQKQSAEKPVCWRLNYVSFFFFGLLVQLTNDDIACKFDPRLWLIDARVGAESLEQSPMPKRI